MLLEAGFTRERMLGYRLRPIAIRDGFRPVPVDPADDEDGAILGRIWDASDALPVGAK